jgi:hypothetical protein
MRKVYYCFPPKDTFNPYSKNIPGVCYNTGVCVCRADLVYGDVEGAGGKVRESQVQAVPCAHFQRHTENIMHIHT